MNEFENQLCPGRFGSIRNSYGTPSFGVSHVSGLVFHMWWMFWRQRVENRPFIKSSDKQNM